MKTPRDPDYFISFQPSQQVITFGSHEPAAGAWDLCIRDCSGAVIEVARRLNRLVAVVAPKDIENPNKSVLRSRLSLLDAAIESFWNPGADVNQADFADSKDYQEAVERASRILCVREAVLDWMLDLSPVDSSISLHARTLWKASSVVLEARRFMKDGDADSLEWSNTPPDIPLPISIQALSREERQARKPRVRPRLRFPCVPDLPPGLRKKLADSEGLKLGDLVRLFLAFCPPEGSQPTSVDAVCRDAAKWHWKTEVMKNYRKMSNNIVRNYREPLERARWIRRVGSQEIARSMPPGPALDEVKGELKRIQALEKS